MVRSRLNFFAAPLVLSCALFFSGPLTAQEWPYRLPPLIPSEPVTIDDVPNVPDARGCVKQCFFDTSPCDPAYFKHADNRCGNKRYR